MLAAAAASTRDSWQLSVKSHRPRRSMPFSRTIHGWRKEPARLIWRAKDQMKQSFCGWNGNGFTGHCVGWAKQFNENESAFPDARKMFACTRCECGGLLQAQPMQCVGDNNVLDALIAKRTWMAWDCPCPQPSLLWSCKDFASAKRWVGLWVGAARKFERERFI